MTTTPMCRMIEPTIRPTIPAITAMMKAAIMAPMPPASAIAEPGISIALNPRNPTIAERTALMITALRSR